MNADTLALPSAADNDQSMDRVRALKHTPGPWRFSRINMPQTWDFFEVTGPDGKDVAAIDNTERGIETEEANARLIAAAPDLVEMLKRLLRSAVPNDRESSAWKEAQALIDSLPQSANAGESQSVATSEGSAKA